MKTLRILTIIFSMMILIGAGHGVGPLVIFELFGIPELLAGNVKFNLIGRYEDRLAAAAMVALIGQAILITTFFFDTIVQSTLTIIGCVIILTAILILTYDASDMNLSMFSLLFSIPAILSAAMLLIIEGKKIARR